MFQPVLRYFQKIGNSNYFSAWKLKVLSDESIKPPATSNNSLAPALNYINTKLRVKFDGNYLKQDEATFTYNKGVNIYSVSEIKLWLFTVGKDSMLWNWLFGAVNLTTNADPEKY